jgi:hypothetical protein
MYSPKKGFLFVFRKPQTVIESRFAVSHVVKVHVFSIRDPLHLVDTIDLSLKPSGRIGAESRFDRLYYAGFERIEPIPITEQEAHGCSLCGPTSIR